MRRVQWYVLALFTDNGDRGEVSAFKVHDRPPQKAVAADLLGQRASVRSRSRD